MTTKIWIYEGRNTPAAAYWNYQDARDQQDEDNHATLDEIIASDPFTDYAGSEEEGFFYIDDGGAITLVEVEGIQNPVKS